MPSSASTAFELSPEKLIASAATLPLTAPFGEQFQYSNQIFAIGGYAAAAAAGGSPDDLYHAYTLAMREQVLGPIGMERSTFSLADVLADGDYAVLAPRRSGRRDPPAVAAQGSTRLHGGSPSRGALVERAGDGPLRPDAAGWRRRP